MKDFNLSKNQQSTPLNSEVGSKISSMAPTAVANQSPNLESDLIAFNGFEQVLEMLEIADYQLKTTLLKNISMRSPKLAHILKKALDERSS